MPTDTTESPADRADFVTTMKHIAAITNDQDDGKLASLRHAIDDLIELRYRIADSVKRCEVPTRDDLKGFEMALLRYEDAFEEQSLYRDRASTAIGLLTGSLLREPNGDVVERETASDHAVSEAII